MFINTFTLETDTMNATSPEIVHKSVQVKQESAKLPHLESSSSFRKAMCAWGVPPVIFYLLQATSSDILGLFNMLWETISVIELKTHQHSVKTQICTAYIIHSLGTPFFLFAFIFIFIPTGQLGMRSRLEECVQPNWWSWGSTGNFPLLQKLKASLKNGGSEYKMQRACKLLLTPSNILPSVPV